jgi:SAM-dependent methyltransferase
MKLEKLYKILYKSYNDLLNLTLLHKLFLFFLILIFFLLLNNKRSNYENYEDMTSGKKFETKYDDAIYDSFYVTYYDALYSNKECNVEQLKLIITYAKNNKFVKFLDIGCGTGYHVHMLNKMKYNVTGLDKSQAMINKAKLKYADCTFVVGDFLQNNLFDYANFTHLLCLNKTFYSFKDKELFFEKSSLLLNADGLLIIHIVDRNTFSPFVISKNDKTVLFNTNDLNLNENKNDNKTLSLNIVKINNNLEYISEYKILDKNIIKHKDETINVINDIEKTPFSCYDEKFTNLETNAVRKQVINLYIPTIDEIITMAKSKDFKVKDKKPLHTCGINTEFLLILKKSL